ncbi:hypothetical protein CTAYLR_009535 [Chrysophaeum taylorii]|uniref:Brix domain-containing protein n=1 Tax=Chrysophaeum taylorii TaxID=2483200 RepID=A0AAD7UHX7_9STRA|nr:hypothetical protein CTAYLR_009535 [Chrysophaeum taylorii]
MPKTKKRRISSPPPPQAAAATTEKDSVIPRSMIVRRGRASKAILELVSDLRHVMAPNTAERLRESPSHTLKDLVKAATTLGVTHLVMVSQVQEHVNLRIARLPAGPTLSFKVASFQLARRVRAEQAKPFGSTAALLTSPLLVLNNFSSDEPHIKLLRIAMEAMFPAIDVATVELADCRRVVLCQYVGDDTVEIRHYAIKAKLVGVSKPVRQILEARRPPDLSKLKDVADFLLTTTEDDNDRPAPEEDASVVLPTNYVGRGNAAQRTSSIGLAELGPRLALRLYKVEKGLAKGDVLFHAFAAPEKAAAGAASG